MSINRTHNTREWRRQGDRFIVRETWLDKGKPVTGFMMVGNGWALRHTPKQAPDGWFEPDEDGGLEWVDAAKADKKADKKG